MRRQGCHTAYRLVDVHWQGRKFVRFGQLFRQRLFEWRVKRRHDQFHVIFHGGQLHFVVHRRDQRFFILDIILRQRHQYQQQRFGLILGFR